MKRQVFVDFRFYHLEVTSYKEYMEYQNLIHMVGVEAT